MYEVEEVFVAFENGVYIIFSMCIYILSFDWWLTWGVPKDEMLNDFNWFKTKPQHVWGSTTTRHFWLISVGSRLMAEL